MKISHHLDDATVVAFAAGTLGEAHRVVVSAHVTMCRVCRDAVRAAEAVGGMVFQEQDGDAVSDGCRAATLASLDGAAQTMAVKVRGPLSDVPLPLGNLLGGKSLADLKWKVRAPGVAKFDIEMSPGSRTRLQLMRLGSGRKMPDHGHGGEELTLILKGSYSDHTGRYLPGDVADLDEETEHQQMVDSDEDCICLIATEAPTRFKSIWARLAQPFVGI